MLYAQPPAAMTENPSGGLNGNEPHRCIYLTLCSQVGGAVWVGLGGGALLEEMCHRLSDFRGHIHVQCALCFLFVAQDVSPQLQSPDLLPADTMPPLFLWDHKPK